MAEMAIQGNQKACGSTGNI